MSLDVWLKSTNTIKVESRQAIFVRQNGQTVEVSREEWDTAHPGQEPVSAMIGADDASDEVFSYNITHNLSTIASAANVYSALWRPDEIGATHAVHLIEPLTVGLINLSLDRERLEKMNPANGWGSYAGLVTFVAKYLAACRENPNATVHVSR